MIVKLEKYFNYPDLKRQTPNESLFWKEFSFTEEEIDECDYLVILEYPKKDFSIKVNPENIIHICMEPPNEISKYRQYGNKNNFIIFNQFKIKNKSIQSHGALPWHINKNFDFLSELNVEKLEKNNNIVWITSNQKSSIGHNYRMKFLNKIKNLPFVDIYGRGINEINDKWDVLSQSKYSIAFENFQNDYYWTEKIVDSFLSFSMPIYVGCKRISNFFPDKSFIQIDPNDKHIDLYLKEIVNSNKWEESIEDIEKARNLILNEYQLFPFLYNYIKSIESIKGVYQKEKKEIISFKGNQEYFNYYPKIVMIEKNLYKNISKIDKRFFE